MHPSHLNAPYALLVEDEPAIQTIVREVCQDLELPVDVTSSGAEAINAVVCARREPALVMLDLFLPLLDGETVGQEIRRLLGASVPILVLSGAPRERIEAAASRMNAQGWLAKPFDLDELAGAIIRTATWPGSRPDAPFRVDWELWDDAPVGS
jgi:DNA-binding response OmpR family regulator